MTTKSGKSSYTHLVCIAGATTGSTGFLVDLLYPERSVQTRGGGIRPLEASPDECYSSIHDLCNGLQNESSDPISPGASRVIVVYALSGRTPQEVRPNLVRAINESNLGPVPPDNITWIPRGEACFWGAGATGDMIITKAGTVGFAHAFRLVGQGKEVAHHRVGGWGLLSGDDGGGYYIGRRILARLFEESDGRMEPSIFTEQMRELMGSVDVIALTHWIRRHGSDRVLRTAVSELARIAVHLAEDKSVPFCKEVLTNAAALVARWCCISFTEMVRRHGDFGNEGVEIVLHGGLIQNSVLYTDGLCKDICQGLKEAGVAVSIRRLRYRVVVGCLIHGLINRLGYNRRDAFGFLDQLRNGKLVLDSSFSPEVIAKIREVGGSDD